MFLMHCFYSTTTPVLAWFFQVGVSNRCSLVEREVFQGFLPGFGEAEKVKFIVRDQFTEDEALVVWRPGAVKSAKSAI